jgi:hypothetical protein
VRLSKGSQQEKFNFGDFIVVAGTTNIDNRQPSANAQNPGHVSSARPKSAGKQRTLR